MCCRCVLEAINLHQFIDWVCGRGAVETNTANTLLYRFLLVCVSVFVVIGLGVYDSLFINIYFGLFRFRDHLFV